MDIEKRLRRMSLMVKFILILSVIVIIAFPNNNSGAEFRDMKRYASNLTNYIKQIRDESARTQEFLVIRRTDKDSFISISVNDYKKGINSTLENFDCTYKTECSGYFSNREIKQFVFSPEGRIYYFYKGSMDLKLLPDILVMTIKKDDELDSSSYYVFLEPSGNIIHSKNREYL